MNDVFLFLFMGNHLSCNQIFTILLLFSNFFKYLLTLYLLYPLYSETGGADYEYQRSRNLDRNHETKYTFL